MNGPDNKIGWCDFTANPVSGRCQHACSYCYAEAIRKRYKQPVEIKFKPNWFDGRQVDKFIRENDRFPIIFVGSMHDLFGEWIPSAQIQDVINLCAKKDACRFVFLTKNPKRYQEFEQFKYLDNCILGTTVTCHEDEWRIVKLLKAKCRCRMLSIEPMLGDLGKLNLEGIDWVVIGCESLPGGKAGRFQEGYDEAALSLIKQCQAAGVRVYHKQRPVNGRVSKNMSEWPEQLQVRETI